MTSANEKPLPSCLSLKHLSLAAQSLSKPRAAGGELYGTQSGGAQDSYSAYFQRQLHSNWCYAAVAASLGNYYIRGAQWTQDAVVCGVFGYSEGTCTGSNYTDKKCNRPGHLPSALCLVETYNQVVDRVPAILTLRNELVAGRPFVARIQLSGGQGHFVVIADYRYDSNSNPMWWVCDPNVGQKWVYVNHFPTDYPPARGTWTRTYYTQAGNRPGACPPPI